MAQDDDKKSVNGKRIAGSQIQDDCSWIFSPYGYQSEANFERDLLVSSLLDHLISLKSNRKSLIECVFPNFSLISLAGYTENHVTPAGTCSS